MYGIFNYIWLVNVVEYTKHGSYGFIFQLRIAGSYYIDVCYVFSGEKLTFRMLSKLVISIIFLGEEGYLP